MWYTENSGFWSLFTLTRHISTPLLAHKFQTSSSHFELFRCTNSEFIKIQTFFCKIHRTQEIIKEKLKIIFRFHTKLNILYFLVRYASHSLFEIANRLCLYYATACCDKKSFHLNENVGPEKDRFE